MLKKIVVFLLLLNLKSIAFSSPAYDGVVTVKQPDGREIQIRLKGDEWFNWNETEDGYPIVKNKQTKYWEYAAVQSTIGFVLTGKIVGKDLPIGVEKVIPAMIKSLLPDTAKEQKKFILSQLKTSQIQQAPGIQEAAPSITGTAKVLTILVNFADRPLQTTESNWYDRIYGNTNSVKDYYDEVSNNQLVITPAAESYGTSNNGIVIVTLGYNHPNCESGKSDQVTRDAIIAADPYVNFASFDTNSDGSITTNELHVIIVMAGYDASFTGHPSPSVWPHKTFISYSTMTPIADGKGVCYYPGGYTRIGEIQSIPSDHQATIGVVIHELFHDLGTTTRWLGLPDLYDTDDSSYGVGKWCIMAGGSGNSTTYSGDTPSHPCAWAKTYLGWVTPMKISSATDGITFPYVEGCIGTDWGVKQLLDNPSGPEFKSNEIGASGEYFLIENRQKLGYDSALPGDGLLIWHIDESTSTNENENHKLVDLEEASGTQHLDDKTNSGNSFDPYYSGNNTKFNDNTTPNSKLYSGLNSNVGVKNVSASGATMTADITALSISTINPSATSEGGMVMISGSNFGDVQGINKVYFSWGGLPIIESSIVSWSDSLIKCLVPIGTMTGGIVVQTNGDPSSASNQVVFSTGFPESPHNYPDNADFTCTYTVGGSPSELRIKFDPQTKVEYSLFTAWDKIYVMDNNNVNIPGSPFGSTDLAGQVKIIPGSTVKIRLTSDGSNNFYGYKVTTIDSSSPTAITLVNDGTGADIAYTNSTTQLSFNWTPSSDPESGIARYWFAVGTTPFGNDVVNWKSNGAIESNREDNHCSY
ncbi:MAG: M6 family metalloprotease domain-containing protein [Firmicutes bacterium]|nr:M6 family metalloprotease domain-containing protein [Bacillota bacterium]